MTTAVRDSLWVVVVRKVFPEELGFENCDVSYRCTGRKIKQSRFARKDHYLDREEERNVMRKDSMWGNAKYSRRIIKQFSGGRSSKGC